MDQAHKINCCVRINMLCNQSKTYQMPLACKGSHGYYSFVVLLPGKEHKEHAALPK